MKELLGILTSNHFMAVVVGALVTAIIQSSGATTVMVVGFVNAGIMTLTQPLASLWEQTLVPVLRRGSYHLDSWEMLSRHFPLLCMHHFWSGSEPF